jgi:hypothetical protein
VRLSITIQRFFILLDNNDNRGKKIKFTLKDLPVMSLGVTLFIIAFVLLIIPELSKFFRQKKLKITIWNILYFVFCIGWLLFGLYNQYEAESDQNGFKAQTDSLLDENKILQAKIQELSEQSQGNITGGNSYCELVLSDFSKNSAQMTVISHGKFPVYDLNFRIVDADIFQNLMEKKVLNLTNMNLINENIGTIPAGAAVFFPRLPIDLTGVKKNLSVFFSARNGGFSQSILMRKKQSIWYGATQISDRDTVLFEKINTGFLNNGKTKIDW